MDYFSHGIWSYIFFHRTKKPLLAVLFGILPDSGSWMIYFFYNLFTRGFTFGKPRLELVPDCVFNLYNISHSLIVSGVISIIIIWLVYHYRQTIFWYVLAWPISVIVDTLTHTREFLPTPFLWPVSNWAFPGISWGTSWFFRTNIGLIVLSLIYILLWKKGYFDKNNRNKKNVIAKIIFWLHQPIIILWFGLFLVPKSFWPGKVTFHFWFIIGIMVIQLIWALLIFRKFDIICPLTTYMQWLRGYPLKNRKNYDHSFIAETLDKLKVKINYRGVNIVLIVTLILVIVQFVWFK